MVMKRKAARVPARPRKKARAAVLYRAPRMARTNVLNLTRTFWTGAWTPGTATTNNFWQYLQVSLNQIPSIAEYVAVFDSYRINSFTVTFRPRYDGFAGNDTMDVTLPNITAQGSTTLHAIIDPRSSIIPTGTYSASNLNVFLENGRVKSYTGTKPIKLTVKYPCVAEDTNGNTNAKYVRGSYYSTNQTGVVHRGIHVFLQDINLTGTFNQAFDTFYTLNVTFKGAR